MKKRAFILSIIFVVCFTSLAYGEIESSSKDMDGKATHIVSLDPSQASFGVITAYNKVQGTQTFSSMVKNSKADAGINANFFTFATGVATGNIIKDGKAILMSGAHPNFFIDSESKAHVEKLDLSVKVSIESDGKKLDYKSIHINNSPTRYYSCYIFTKERGESLELGGMLDENKVNLSRGMVIVEKNGRIESIKPVEEKKIYNIPAEGHLVYIRGKDFRQEDLESIKPGDSIDISLSYGNSKFNNGNKKLKVEQLVSGNTILLQDAKILPGAGGSKRIRSALGIDEKGHVKMVVQDNVSLRELAENMKKLGCISALNLDGGDSSALYAKGEYLKNTDRKIANALVAYDQSPETLYGLKDLPGKNYWSRPALEYALEKKYLQGDGGYLRPRDSMRRSELATVMNRKLGLEKEADLLAYSDLDDSKWYYHEMAKAVEAGIFQGHAGKLRPEDYISRQEAFTVLARTFKLSEDKDYISGFDDWGQVQPWACKSINALISQGYVNGIGNSLKPKSNLSREEFAQILYKMDRD